MSNTIIIELCAEDRARLDRLAEALESRIVQVEDHSTTIKENQVEGQMQIDFDDVQTKLAETLAKAEAPKNATEELKADIPTTTPPAEEEPTVAEKTEPKQTKTVDRAELKAKVIQLCAKGLKEQTRDIVRAYAQTVTDVPEDKIAECYAKLEALEG